MANKAARIPVGTGIKQNHLAKTFTTCNDILEILYTYSPQCFGPLETLKLTISLVSKHNTLWNLIYEDWYSQESSNAAGKIAQAAYLAQYQIGLQATEATAVAATAYMEEVIRVGADADSSKALWETYLMEVVNGGKVTEVGAVEMACRVAVAAKKEYLDQVGQAAPNGK